MSHDTLPDLVGQRRREKGMKFINNANLGGFYYRVTGVFDNDEYNLDVEPWGLALEKNAPGIMRMSGETIRNIFKN